MHAIGGPFFYYGNRMEKYFETRMSQAHRAGAAEIWRIIAADILRQVGHPIRSAIDIGAGYGDFINGVELEERWALDQWEGMPAHLAQGVNSVVGDILAKQAAVPQRHFDLCFLSNVLEHFDLDQGKKILGSVRSMLKPGGSVAILQPNFTYCAKHYFDDYTHKTIFTSEGLSNFLMDEGFRIERCISRYLPFSFKSRLPRPPWMVKLYLKLPYRPLGAQMLIVARSEV
jgi:hypothetical protein